MTCSILRDMLYMECKPTILILDDDSNTLQVLSRAVQSGGMQAVSFQLPADFLKFMIVGIDKPDCILMDMDMPEMRGTDVLVMLEAMGNKVPVIMITGESDPATASVAMRYGAVDFIVKPIETHDLISRIRSVMQNALAV